MGAFRNLQLTRTSNEFVDSQRFNSVCLFGVCDAFSKLLLCCDQIVDSGIIVDRLGKSAPETFLDVLDRRENGAITRV